MPRAEWPLKNSCPRVEIVLAQANDGKLFARDLLADTGAGPMNSGFELILHEDDCLLCGGNPLQPVNLGGAYAGWFPIYLLSVQIPSLGFSGNMRAVGVPSAPAGFDGIACFSFLNRFHYGNFGNPVVFGLAA